jgi:predicted permease
MGGSTRSSDITLLGHTPGPGEDMIVEDMLVGPGYCETLGVPVLQGRAINARDTASAPKIAIVNDSFAQYFFPGQNPIGQRFHFGDEEEKNPEPIEIVGVIGDMKFQSAKDVPMRAAYRPILQVQDQSAYASSLEIRTAGDPLQVAGSVRQALAQVDEKLPISSVTSLREQLEGSLQDEQLIARLVGFFGLLALLLACVGLYGLMAHAVVRRTNEIGIRMALGAERRDIILMVLKETLLLVGLGVAIGVPMSLAAARLVANQLFGLTPSDPITLVGAATLLAVVAAIAGYVPARRASRVDPLVALRYE